MPEPALAPPENFLARLRSRSPKRGLRPGAPPGPWVLLAAWGPCGYSPIAPGTVGTAGAIPVYWALSQVAPGWGLAATAALFVVAVIAAGRAGRYWGVADASPIVIDEVVGYLVATALVPFSWPAALWAFLLFRLFDVLKPWPASAFDRIKNGFGVVMDDVAAGVFAWAGLQLLALALRVAAGCGSGGHWWCAEVGP